ncbi:MAG: 2-oxoglutarate ferredoxin oxidoreductase subunit alpha, partial [Planctomycetota bacterium]
YGRNGESPLPIIAAKSPADCFSTAIEAWRVAVKFMSPVIILSDGYIANGSEPWAIPDTSEMAKIEIEHPTELNDGENFLPYKRDEFLARPWAIPGTPDLMHRVGGLEKQDGTGNVSYDPDNHQHMVLTRNEKVDLVAQHIDEIEVEGAESGTLVISWGGTFGACRTAVKTCLAQGLQVGHVHCRWISPFPRNLGDIIKRYDHVLVPELNNGQLLALLKTKYLVDAQGLNKIKGKPFHVSEVVEAIKAIS